MMAAPAELAICWVMFNSVDPRATSSCFKVRSAAVNNGIIVPPIPSPSTNRVPSNTAYDVSYSTRVRPIMPIRMTSTPVGTIRPTGKRSTSAPANGIVTIAPSPCGAINRPASSGNSPRTTWKYVGTNSRLPKNAMPNNSIVTTDTVRLKSLNNRRSISGWRGLYEYTTNNATSATPIPIVTKTLVSQPVPVVGNVETP